MSWPWKSVTNFSSVIPSIATTAFFRPPSLPTSTSCSNRFSPLASLFGFFTQNFGLGNFSKRNSLGAGGLPENDTLPSTVPPAHEVSGAARSAIAPIAIAVNTPTFFMSQSSLLERVASSKEKTDSHSFIVGRRYSVYHRTTELCQV